MEDDEYKKLPLDERCTHKLWKARLNGYEEVTKLFRQIDDEKSPEFGKYLGLVKKFVIDSNVACQEKGVEAVLAYVENYANAGKTVSEVMSGIVMKCIAAPKTRTRELALQLTLMYIEIEKYDAVEEELIKGMEQKNPKIVAACINACTIALREFGSKIINVKPLVKKITPLFADRDKAVRDEARIMVIEMYRWVGPALKSQLSNLQPVQVSELETEFGKIDGQKAIPTRYIRSQQQKQIELQVEQEVIDGDGDEVDDDGDGDGNAQQIDPYDLADPVDILTKLPKDFYEKLEAKKWLDRKEAVEALENLLKTPKLENGDYGDLVRALKKIIQKDSNVIVVAFAGRCLANLAAGLKKRFQIYSSTCVSALLEKFKEKKQNVVSAIREAIDNIYLTTTIEAILEDVIEALGNKNPSVKMETALFLARAFTKTLPTAINKKTLKALTVPLLKNINEPDPGVRDATAEALGTLMKLVGEKTIGPFLIELEKDNLKMTKIKEFCDKAVITIKVSAVKKDRPTTAPVKTKSTKTQNGTPAPTPRSAPNRPASSANTKKKPDISSGSATVVRTKNKTSTKLNSKPIERELSDDEVEQIIVENFTNNTINELSDSNWKIRLEAAEQFLKQIQTLDNKDIPTQAIIKILIRKPGLKDTNFQVLKIKLDIVKYLAENTKFSTTTTDICLVDIAEKFGDPKNGNLVGETMVAIAETTSLSYVSGQVIEFALNQKSPKVIQESLLWLASAIKEFGFLNLNAKLLIDNTKKALSSTNPAVRQAAITFCGVLYLYMGASIHMFFENEKPALRDQITCEFNKYEGEKPPIPIRGTVKNSASSNSLDNLDNDDDNIGEQQTINVQDLIPRVDISGQITESLINEIDDKNWKVRNEALIKLNNIVQEAKFIKTNLGDLPQALSHRLTDSNTKIAQTSLNICEHIAKAMGPPCKQYIKVFFPYFLQNLGDNKSWMRTTALDTITAYSDQCGYKEFFENEMIGDALKTGSPTLRIELWAWLADKLPKIPVKSIPREELLVCIPHLYNNLEDRNADVRKNAQEAILGIMIHIGYDSMVKQTEKLKPGSKNTVMALLEKTRPNLPVKPLPKKSDKDDKAVRGTKAVANSKNAVKPKNTTSTTGTATPTTAAATTTTKTAPSSGRKKDEDIDTSPLLAVNNMKNQRAIDETKLKILKWNFTTPREEFVELLKDQMTTANVNKTLIFNMFHTDFRYHIKAIESLMEDLPYNRQALISNLDLILKWLTLRFFDTNPSVLLKGLDYLNTVFKMLIENQYRLSENEASSFLPYLVVKIGDPKDSVRNGVRALLNLICEVYSVSRLFSYVMEGLKSKNARQRAECLEVMGSIIQRFGMTVCGMSPNACLKEVAKQISDRDNAVRNAALNCVVHAYNIVGEKVYKMIGNIAEKDLSLLEERIKRSSKKLATMKVPSQIAKIEPIVHNSPSCEIETTTLPSTTTITTNTRIGNGDIIPPIPSNNIDDDNVEDEEDEHLPPVRTLPSQTVQQETNDIIGPFKLDPELLNELDRRTVPMMRPIKEFDLEFLKSDVKIPKLSEADIKARMVPLSPPKPLDPNLSLVSRLSMEKLNIPKRQDQMLINYINQISSNDIYTAIKGVDQVSDFLQNQKSTLPNPMLELENEFYSAIVIQMKHLHEQDPVDDVNVAKLYRNIFTLIETFYRDKRLGRQCSIQVLRDIINEFISLLVDGKLQKCPNGETYIRVINFHCVKIIEKSDHTRIICALIRLIHECVRLDYSPRHTELVMKCLWRVVKLMPDWDSDDIDYDLVLLDIHNFLKEFPSNWWKTKPLDTTLRTVKTILHSIVKIKGGTIMLHLGKIPNTSESEVESYILKLLKSMKLEEVKQVPLKTEAQRRSLTRANHNLLTDIFQKIGSKDETKDGLTLLYDFIQQHPEADIEPFLKKSSKFFQDYIQLGLKDIEKSRQLSAKASTLGENVEAIPPTTTTGTGTVATTQKTDDGPEYWMERLNKWRELWGDTNNKCDVDTS